MSELAMLRREARRLSRELDEAHKNIESLTLAGLAAGYLEAEVKALREFIADVRLGVRDLSEYEDVCGHG